MKLDYFKIAFLEVRAKRLRSWLTILGIIIGVLAVVALIGLGDGLRAAITSQLGITSTEVLTVQAGGLTAAGPPGTGVLNPLTVDDAKAIEKISDVESAIPRMIETLSADFNEKREVVFAVSMPAQEKRKIVEDLAALKIDKGRALKDGDKNKLVVGANFEADTNAFGKSIVVGSRLVLNGKEFEVVGIYKKRGSFTVDGAFFVNEDYLRDLLNEKEKASVIGVKVKGKEVIDSATIEIEKVLRKRRDVKVGEEDFTVQTPQAALSSLNQVLTGVQIFVAVVASISILVGAIGIINTMFTTVLERRSQIGIMKAIGAKNSDIFFIFLFESGILGLIGGLIGVFLGTLVSYAGTVGINSLIGSTTIPKIDFILIGGALFGSFLIGAVAGLVPAMRAAKQKPVDALRG